MFIVSDQILSEKKDKDKVGDLVRSMLPLTIVTCPEEVTDLLQLLQSLIDFGILINFMSQQIVHQIFLTFY